MDKRGICSKRNLHKATHIQMNEKCGDARADHHDDLVLLACLRKLPISRNVRFKKKRSEIIPFSRFSGLAFLLSFSIHQKIKRGKISN